MLCVRCENILTGKQTRFCSPRCSKLYLKAQYKRRNKDKVNAYNRVYRSSYTPLKNDKLREELLNNNVCLRCGSKDNLNINHIKHQKYGLDNSPNNLVVLCFDCHMLWHAMLDDILKEYWVKRIRSKK